MEKEIENIGYIRKDCSNNVRAGISLMAGNQSGYPTVFEMDGDEFMIGSEVGLYLNMVRGALYKKFPSLWRRVASPEERKRIIDLLPQNSHALSSCITLLRASEAMEIIKGVGDRYRKGSFVSSMKDRSISVIEDEKIFENEKVADLPLIDPNFSCTPAIQYNVDNKRIRTYPLFFTSQLHDYKEELFPIILNISVNDTVLKDYFTWNLYETEINLWAFAELLCDDLGFPPSTFVPLIVSSMESQIDTYKDMIETADSSSTEEKRVVIKLDICLNGVRLQDQFEWDMNDKSSSPELFATSLVNELGLSLEFIQRISVDIRCQLNWYRSVYARHENFFLPSLSFPNFRDRDCIEDWTPRVTKFEHYESQK